MDNDSNLGAVATFDYPASGWMQRHVILTVPLVEVFVEESVRLVFYFFAPSHISNSFDLTYL